MFEMERHDIITLVLAFAVWAVMMGGSIALIVVARH